MHDVTPTLFSQVQLVHGPLSILGRTILAAEQLTNHQGVHLRFVTPEQFLAANQANVATWHPLLSHFDCRYSALGDTNTFFILGADETGDTVACQAARFFDWQDTSFKEECESLRLFYRDPASMKRPGERCEVSSIAAKGASGRVVFSGAAWYRPDYRGKGLVEYLPRIARALARSIWDTSLTVTIMSEANIRKGVFPRNGYRNMEWAVEMFNAQLGDLRCAFMWTKDDEMLDDLVAFLAGVGPRVETAVRAAGAK